MRRFSLMFTALAFGLLAGAESASAQALTMQMSNGWTFSFSGNVNAFYVYESESDDGTVANGFNLVGAGRQGSAIRTGLLPAFAVFEASGREGNTDLKVHFGFAPQIQTLGGVHDNFLFGTQAGAQIDMRQVYLTVGGDWGQILAGREIGVYQRQNILNDQTLFGTGATGGNFGLSRFGTTLGRIGFGYVYPNFNAQITYSSPAGRPGQFTVGLFDPSEVPADDIDETTLPRVEAEFVYSAQSLTFWVGGLVQNHKDTGLDETMTALGVSGGIKYAAQQFSLVGSGYYGQGIGTTLMFNGGRSGVGGSTDLRPSFGFIGQGTFTPTGSKATFGASYGQSTLQTADDEGDADINTNGSITAGVYYQATPSLKVVGEGTYAWSDDDVATEKNTSVAISGGLMLFF